MKRNERGSLEANVDNGQLLFTSLSQSGFSNF